MTNTQTSNCPRVSVLGALGLVLSVTSTLGACAEDGEGTITVTTYGEAFIEEGIPADDLADGWAIDFETFEVSLNAITVAGQTLADPDPIELTTPSNGARQALGAITVAEGSYGDATFRIDELRVVGSATDGADTVTFDWTFSDATRYEGCEATTVVADGGQATFQITVHADHLFYDSLVSEEPDLRFQAIADADSDGDGAVTQAELAAADIGAYDPGNSDADDLWSFLVEQSRTVGHVDGEGHCDARPAN
jgi:hypothetical protein